MTLHLRCAFELIILPNKGVIGLLITFSYKLCISLKSVENRITPEILEEKKLKVFKFSQPNERLKKIQVNVQSFGKKFKFKPTLAYEECPIYKIYMVFVF